MGPLFSLAITDPEGVPYWLAAVIGTALISTITTLFLWIRSLSKQKDLQNADLVTELKEAQAKHNDLQETLTKTVERLSGEHASEQKVLIGRYHKICLFIGERLEGVADLEEED